MPNTETRAAFERFNCCVIIPTYNNAGTLKGVIESVLAFTDNIIVVNDGSTDETRNVLVGFEEIQVLHFPSGGCDRLFDVRPVGPHEPHDAGHTYFAITA